MRIIIAVIIVASLGLSACGVSRETADTAFKQAVEDFKKLKEDQASSAETLLARTHLKRAQAALKDEDFGDAKEIADNAIYEIGKVFKSRERKSRMVLGRLATAKGQFIKLVYPRQELINNYFDAISYYQEKNYDDAIKELNLFDDNYKMDRVFDKESRIRLEYPEDEMKRDDSIPIYMMVTPDGELQNMISKLPNRFEAAFVESYWVDRKTRFIHIKFEGRPPGADPDAPPTKMQSYEGWIDPKFLAK